MAEDFGVVISQPGSSVNDASGNQLSMSKPFLKLDTQVPTAFQSILLLITTDPPEPVAPAKHTYTIVYQFNYGYTYTPAVETLFYVQSPPPGNSYTKRYNQDLVILGQQTVDDYATLYAVTGGTSVYYVVDKYNDGNGHANLLTGTTVQISSHVFLNGF